MIRKLTHVHSEALPERAEALCLVTAAEQGTTGKGWQPLFYDEGIKVQSKGDLQVPTNEPSAEVPATQARLSEL